MNDTANLIKACFVLTLAMCLAAGCGGPTKKAPAPAPPAAAQNEGAAPPAPGVPGNPAADNSQNTAKASSKSKTKKAGTPEEPVEVEPPGPDDFVLTSDQIITEVENPKPKPPPALFDVAPIAKGLDSSNLVLVSSDPTPTENATGTSIPATSPMHRANRTTNPGNAPTNNPANNSANPATAKTGQPAAGGKDAADAETLSLPSGFTAVIGSQNDPESGLPLRIHGERDPVEMVLIHPGVFLRGADVSDATVSPRHTVLMEHPYYIDTVEVTVARYNAFREHFRKTEGRKLEGSVNHDGHQQYPAVGIKFFDAKFYAKWASKELPTETQWERAARGDKGADFPWGDGRPIFHLPRVPGQLDPVGMYPGDKGPFGVYDMAGNAREWCLDLFQADIYQKEINLGAGTVRNPVGPKSAPGIKQQVVRGGHADWAVWHRSALPQNETAPDIGFRCVLNILPGAKSKTEKGEKGEKSSTKKADDKKKSGLKL